jgi:mRNA interferase RelE/StbE
VTHWACEAYEPDIASSVSRIIGEQLSEGVAWAVIEFINGPLIQNPRRVGHELHDELDGYYGAHLGDYRIVYAIDDENCLVWVVRVARRADVYGIG